MEGKKLGTGGYKRREQRWDGQHEIRKELLQGFDFDVAGEV